MINKKELEKIKKSKSEWEKKFYNPEIKKLSERKEKFENLSWNEIKNLYAPEDIPHIDYLKNIGFPGTYPSRSLSDYASWSSLDFSSI